MKVSNVTYQVMYQWDEEKDKKKEIMAAIKELYSQLAKEIIKEET